MIPFIPLAVFVAGMLGAFGHAVYLKIKKKK